MKTMLIHNHRAINFTKSNLVNEMSKMVLDGDMTEIEVFVSKSTSQHTLVKIKDVSGSELFTDIDSKVKTGMVVFQNNNATASDLASEIMHKVYAIEELI